MPRLTRFGMLLATLGTLSGVVGCSDDPTPPADSGADVPGVDVPGDEGPVDAGEDVRDAGEDVRDVADVTDVPPPPMCPSVEFLRPAAMAVLGVADDLDRDCSNGFTYNVQVATNAPMGTRLELRVNGRTAGMVTVTGPTVTFPNVSLDTAGTVSLEVRVEGVDTACATGSTSVSCATPRCQITTPARSTLLASDSTAAMGMPFATNFVVGTDIEDGQPVQLAVSGTIQPLRATAMGGMANFANVPMAPDGTFTVQATCTNRANNVGTSAASMFTVDATPPTLSVARPMAMATIGLSGDTNAMRAGVQFQVCARSDAAGQQLCASVAGSMPDMAGCTTVPMAATQESCVEVSCPDGNAPFDVAVTTRDAAGNETRQTLAGLRCQSSLPGVRVVAPAAYNASEPSTFLNAAADTNPALAGLQTTVVACTDRPSGMAQLFLNDETTPTGAAVAVMPTAMGDPCASAGMGFVGIARFTGVTLPQSFPERSRPDAPAPTGPSVRVAVTDSAGDVGRSSPVQLYVDSVAPVLNLFNCNTLVRPNQMDGSAVADITGTSDTYPITLTLSRTGEMPVTLTLASPTSPGGGARFAAVALRPGVTSAQLRTTDPAGNSSTSVGMCNFTVSNPPTLAFTAPLAGANIIGSRTVTVTLRTDAPVGTAVTLTVNGGAPATAMVATGGTVTFSGVTLPEADVVTLLARTAEVPSRGVAESTISVRVDTLRPSPPPTLTLSVPTSPAPARRAGTIRLSWTEGSDPNPSGMGTRAVGRYEVRRAPSQITPENYGFAQVVPNTLVPGAPGAANQLDVPGQLIARNTWFAIRSIDSAGNTSPTVTIAGPIATQLITERVSDPAVGLGEAVSGGFDVNGDGLDDLVVGTSSTTPTGAARVYFGNRAGAMGASFTEFRGSAGARFGVTVASLGDVNGDGLGDIAIGEATFSPTGPGSVFIYFGRRTWRTGSSFYPSTEADVTIAGGTGEFSVARLGSALARVGDFDGDGLNDVAIGAPGTTNAPSNARGAVVIFRGRRTWPATLLPTAAELIIRNSDTTVLAFGRYLAGGGRLVGSDTREDLIVGGGSTSQAGAVYAFAGRELNMPLALLDSDNSFRFNGAAAGARRWLGGGVGDINGDGRSDLAVGAGAAAGAVSLFFGNAQGGLTPGPTIAGGPSPTDVFGINVGSITDPRTVHPSLREPEPTGASLLVCAESVGGQNPRASAFSSRTDWTTATPTNAETFFSISAPGGQPILTFQWIGDFDGDGFVDAAYGQPVGTTSFYIVR